MARQAHTDNITNNTTYNITHNTTTQQPLTTHPKVAAWKDGKCDWNDVVFVDRILNQKVKQKAKIAKCSMAQQGEQYTAVELQV